MATNYSSLSTVRPVSPREKSRLKASPSDSGLSISSAHSTSPSAQVNQVRFLENNYDWVVIGNGPHGNIFATTMVKKGLSPKKLVMVDPYDALELWTKLNTNGGWSRNAEEVSRETDVSQSTEQYRTLNKLPLPITNRKLFEFLEALRTHISSTHIPHIKAMATTIQRADDGYSVEVREGSPIKAKNVVLAIGNYTEPVWPEWARQLKTEHQTANIHHIFDLDFSLEEFKKSWQDVVIVGGGPAAINLALILSSLKPGKVTLLMRHPMRGTGVSLVDPCHLPEEFEANDCYRTFRRLPSSEARRKYIEENRPIGAVGKSIDFMAALEDALSRGQLKVIQGETIRATASSEGIQMTLKPKSHTSSRLADIEEGVDFVPYLSEPSGRVLIDSSVSDFDRPIEYEDPGLTTTSSGKVVLDPDATFDRRIMASFGHGARTSAKPAAVTLSISGLGDEPLPKNLSASSVLLATGFANRRPGGAFLDRVISDLNLGTYPDGYPKVDEHLQWAPGLYTMGRLSDHEMGPYSWNVTGGIFATKRIVESNRAKASLSSPALEFRTRPVLSLLPPHESDESLESPETVVTSFHSKPSKKPNLLSWLPLIGGLFSSPQSAPVMALPVNDSPTPSTVRTDMMPGDDTLHSSTASVVMGTQQAEPGALAPLTTVTRTDNPFNIVDEQDRMTRK